VVFVQDIWQLPICIAALKSADVLTYQIDPEEISGGVWDEVDELILNCQVDNSSLVFIRVDCN
jgi:hypothetical protein